MPKQHYRHSYDEIDIFQKLSDYYASSNINIKKSGISPKCPILNRMYIQVKE